MSATASKPATCHPQVLDTYECDEGTRQLVAQRINGKVALSDVPAGDAGKVYLVERHIPGLDELNGIAYDYCELAERLGRPPMQSDWILTN
jgi:hypothetical protein